MVESFVFSVENLIQAFRVNMCFVCINVALSGIPHPILIYDGFMFLPLCIGRDAFVWVLYMAAR